MNLMLEVIYTYLVSTDVVCRQSPWHEDCHMYS